MTDDGADQHDLGEWGVEFGVDADAGDDATAGADDDDPAETCDVDRDSVAGERQAPHQVDDTERGSDKAMPMLAPDEDGFATACPWCIRSAEHFVERPTGLTGCGNCGAVIPVDADWYQNGEKVTL